MKKYVNAEENIDMLTPEQIAALADIYDNGDGALANEDTEKSIMYCKMAAKMGNAYAQSVLANAYTIGRDVEKSDEQALFWYKKSAEQGNPYAQYEVGMRISEEEGALLWLHASAKQGFTMAMKELSDRLREVDPKKSKKWLRRYYRKKDTIETLHGKKYMKSIRKMPMPEVIDGEVVIRI